MAQKMCYFGVDMTHSLTKMTLRVIYEGTELTPESALVRYWDKAMPPRIRFSPGTPSDFSWLSGDFYPLRGEDIAWLPLLNAEAAARVKQSPTIWAPRVTHFEKSSIFSASTLNWDHSLFERITGLFEKKWIENLAQLLGEAFGGQATVEADIDCWAGNGQRFTYDSAASIAQSGSLFAHNCLFAEPTHLQLVQNFAGYSDPFAIVAYSRQVMWNVLESLPRMTVEVRSPGELPRVPEPKNRKLRLSVATMAKSASARCQVAHTLAWLSQLGRCGQSESSDGEESDAERQYAGRPGAPQSAGAGNRSFVTHELPSSFESNFRSGKSSSRAPFPHGKVGPARLGIFARVPTPASLPPRPPVPSAAAMPCNLKNPTRPFFAFIARLRTNYRESRTSCAIRASLPFCAPSWAPSLSSLPA